MKSILDVLKMDPLKFLKTYPIKISTAGKSEIKENVTYGQKTMSSMMGGQTVLYFNNAFTQYDPTATVEYCKAHAVQAQHGAPNFYTLTDDCDFMITTELSGCCMILDKSGSSMKIAHRWPEKGVEDGNLVQDALARDYPQCKLYGKRNYVQDYAYVIGVHKGAWRFYAQERPGGKRIEKALEIFL